MSIIGTIYEDVTADVLGNNGPWQRLVVFIATVYMTNSFFIHDEDIYLIHPTAASVICIPPESYGDIYNDTLCTFTLKNGTTIKQCNGWYVKLLGVFWIKKSWIIFCDDKMKLLLTAVIFRLARVFGFVIYGLVADSFGRKKAIIIDVFGALVLRVVISFCDSEGWYRLVLFLLSVLTSANVYMGIIIVCEIASNKYRSWLSLIAISPRLLASVLSLPLATASPNAETYNLIACFTSILYIALLKWTPESPQWLLFNKKITLAEKTLYRAAQLNNIIFSAEFKIRPVNQRAYSSIDQSTVCAQILTTYNIRIIIGVCMLFWGLFYFLWGTIYLKIYLTGVDRNLLIKIICFFIGLGIIGWCLSTKLLLQQFLVINVVLTALFTTGVMICKHPIAHDFLSAIALASGMMVHAMILTITPRLYATNIRATLFGCCHAIGQLGALLSYIFVIYNTLDDITFIVLELLVSISLVGVSFMLPHVDGREMPDVLEDMDYFCELSKPLRWASQKRASPSKEEVEMRIHSYASALTTNSGGAAASERDAPPPAQPIGPKRLSTKIMNFIRNFKQ